ncbi:hypothetical protein H2199_000348 [Coniosporium tulheliwenetii]|uniref:Uncharacterized protein n=1 Tax=Coniosporium tulheliwenetii TaxID=3383036 RepID=A0ACC2ZPQ4_9PEZI|nr:hypothetical protein H2199_000348 [Cladosporium sp. JES 115]
MRPTSSPPVSPTTQPASMAEPDASESFALEESASNDAANVDTASKAGQEGPVSHLALILRQAPDHIPILSGQKLLDCLFRALLAEYARQDRIQAQNCPYPSEREIWEAEMADRAVRDEEVSRQLARRDSSAFVDSLEEEVDMDAGLQELEIRDRRCSPPATRRNSFDWDRPATEDDFYAVLAEWEADERQRRWNLLVGSGSQTPARAGVEFVAPRPGYHVRLPVYRVYRARRSRRCWQWLKGVVEVKSGYPEWLSSSRVCSGSLRAIEAY